MSARLDPAGGLWLAGLGLFCASVGLLAGVDPKLALVAAIGAGFVLLVATDLAAGLAVFGFFSFLEVLQLGSAVSVGKLGGALLALGWLGALATGRERHRDFLTAHPWMAATLILFLGWSLLSAAWAQDSAAAVGDTARFALNAILFLIVFTAIRSRGQAIAVSAAFVAGTVAATVYGLLTIGVGADPGRLGGAGLDPNEMAAVLVAGIALSAGLAANLRRWPGLRLAAVAAGAFCLLGLFLTLSRGGMVALVVTLLAALLLAGRWRPQVLVVGLLAAAVTLFYFGFAAPPEARERIASATKGQKRSADGRTTIWTVGWRMVEDNPVAGVGTGNFQRSTKDYLLQPGTLRRSDNILADAPKVAHNTYLGVLAELGVVGLSLFLAIVGFSLVCALRAAAAFATRGERGGEALARAFAVALVGTLAAGFFISQELNKQLWLLLGFGPALLAVSGAAAQRRDPGPDAS